MASRALLLLAACALGLRAETAVEIMAKVAIRQDADVAARSEFVYHQNLLVRMKRVNGKPAREEIRDYSVIPGPAGVKRQLVSFSGKIGDGKKTITYDSPDFRYKGIDIDGEVVQGVADDFGADAKSKDGISHDLFPLRSEQMKRYVFTLVGTTEYQGHAVYHLTFEATGKHSVFDDDDDCWAGEVMVDAVEYQPWMVSSHFACKIPVAVKTLLGTNVHQIGFKVTYDKFGDGVWFPVSYGGEFAFRAAFFYARSVGVGLVNSGFQRTKVDASIKYEGQ